MGETSTWNDFLDTHFEGVHDIAFEIKYMDDRIPEMKDRGTGLIRQGNWTDYSGGRSAYFKSNDARVA